MGFYGWKLLIVCSHPANFVVGKSCGRGEKVYLICRVTLQDHVSKGHMTLWVKDPPDKLPLPPSLQPNLVTMDNVVVEI